MSKEKIDDKEILNTYDEFIKNDEKLDSEFLKLINEYRKE